MYALRTLLLFSVALYCLLRAEDKPDDPLQSLKSINLTTLSIAQRKVVEKGINGDPEAVNTIGLVFKKGDSSLGKQSYETSFKLFQHAAQLMNTQACVNLATAYFEGQGTARSTVDALRWYHVAAGAGHQGALYNVGLILAQVHNPILILHTFPPLGPLYLRQCPHKQQ